jgi:hypothetical protein
MVEVDRSRDHTDDPREASRANRLRCEDARIDTPPRRRNSFVEYAAANQWVWLVVGGVAALASFIGAVWSFTSGHPVVALFITFAVSFIAFGAFIAWSDRG